MIKVIKIKSKIYIFLFKWFFILRVFFLILVEKFDLEFLVDIFEGSGLMILLLLLVFLFLILWIFFLYDVKWIFFCKWGGKLGLII